LLFFGCASLMVRWCKVVLQPTSIWGDPGLGLCVSGWAQGVNTDGEWW
jgi:hypothetical protein